MQKNGRETSFAGLSGHGGVTSASKAATNILTPLGIFMLVTLNRCNPS